MLSLVRAMGTETSGITRQKYVKSDPLPGKHIMYTEFSLIKRNLVNVKLIENFFKVSSKSLRVKLSNHTRNGYVTTVRWVFIKLG